MYTPFANRKINVFKLVVHGKFELNLKNTVFYSVHIHGISIIMKIILLKNSLADYVLLGGIVTMTLKSIYSNFNTPNLLQTSVWNIMIFMNSSKNCDGMLALRIVYQSKLGAIRISEN